VETVAAQSILFPGERVEANADHQEIRSKISDRKRTGRPEREAEVRFAAAPSEKKMSLSLHRIDLRLVLPLPSMIVLA